MATKKEPETTAEATAEPIVEAKAAVKKSDKPTGKEAKLKQSRRKLVKESQAHESDTGSTEVQIAVLTGKIADLSKHLKDHPKDHDSRQGLLKMVGRRRRLLRFLKKGSEADYNTLVKELKLRK